MRAILLLRVFRSDDMKKIFTFFRRTLSKYNIGTSSSKQTNKGSLSLAVGEKPIHLYITK